MSSTFDLASRIKDGSVILQDLHGRYYESTSRGNVFVASITSTGSDGYAPGTAVSTTPPFTLYNPKNSGVLLSIISTLYGQLSGTCGAGTIFYLYNNDLGQAIPNGGTALTPLCMNLGNLSLPKAKAYKGATLAATPSLLRSAFVINAYSNQNGVANQPLKDYIDGSLVILPGASLSLQEVGGAGTTPLVTIDIAWEEVLI